jgi:pilus assembly protein Flp/PilA
MFMLFAPKEKGQGLVEYAIILALIAIVVIGIMGTLGKKVNNTFNSIGASMTM